MFSDAQAEKETAADETEEDEKQTEVDVTMTGGRQEAAVDVEMAVDTEVHIL